MNEYAPDFASPPGDTIRECLEDRRIAINSFARKLREPIDVVAGLLEGTRAITPDLATRLEKIFGVEKQFWLNRQKHYEEAQKRLET